MSKQVVTEEMPYPRFDEKGREIPDPRPMELPTGFATPESLESMMARMVKDFSARAAEEGKETFEESCDFEVEDEEDGMSAAELRSWKLEELAEERAQLEELERELRQEEQAAKIREQVESRRPKKKKAPPVPEAPSPESSSGGSE